MNSLSQRLCLSSLDWHWEIADGWSATESHIKLMKNNEENNDFLETGEWVNFQSPNTRPGNKRVPPLRPSVFLQKMSSEY